MRESSFQRETLSCPFSCINDNFEYKNVKTYTKTSVYNSKSPVRLSFLQLAAGRNGKITRGPNFSLKPLEYAQADQISACVEEIGFGFRRKSLKFLVVKTAPSSRLYMTRHFPLSNFSLIKLSDWSGLVGNSKYN